VTLNTVVGISVATLLGQKKEMLPDTLAIIQAETQRTNEKHAQQLEQERVAQQKEYREKSAAIFSSISLSAQKVAAIDHFQYINALR
jgi:hypothetical protein